MTWSLFWQIFVLAMLGLVTLCCSWMYLEAYICSRDRVTLTVLLV
jgi:hypothetical protein